MHVTGGRTSGKISPLAAVAYVFLLEVGVLLLLSVIAAAFMATVPRLPVNHQCDLGQFRFVPYIWAHQPDYCLLAPEGSRYTALYYLASVGTIIGAHALYLSHRTHPTKVNDRYPRALAVMFWLTLISWLFNFKGPRGDWGSLTNGSHLPFFLVIILMSVLQVALVLSKHSYDL